MAEVKKIIKCLNIFCGMATICIGVYLLVLICLDIGNFQVSLIPIYTLPFFLTLFGFMVLSCQFDIPVLKKNCQFLEHKVGILLFYVYVGSFVQGFASAPGLKNLISFMSFAAALSYYALAVLMAVLALIGEQKANNQLGNITQKLTS